MKNSPKVPKALPGLKNFVTQLITGPEKEALAVISRTPELAEEPAALVNCCLHGKSALVEKLLAHGADPNAVSPSHEHYRPLHRAIEHRGIPKNPGHAATVRLLLEAGADPELRSTWMSLTALGVAGMTGDREIIDLVLEYNPRESLFSAAILGEEKKVAKLLKRKDAARSQDENNMTGLHYAALSGLKSLEDRAALARIAQAFCEAGADVNITPKIGPYPSTPVLHFAAWGNMTEVAQVLLERGANPNLGFGNCLWRQPSALAELFVKHGADVNGREPSGQPLLNSRVHWNLTSVVTWLLEKGADPNLTDKEGNTSLHEAYRRGASPKIFEALRKYGAREKLKNKEGKLPAQLARKK